jgi:hypothetical protein
MAPITYLCELANGCIEQGGGGKNQQKDLYGKRIFGNVRITYAD